MNEVESKVSRIVKIFIESKGSIRPHFNLVGPSGCGKTHLIKKVAKEYGINFLEVNAAQLTKEGTAGNSLSKVLAELPSNSKKLTLCFVDEFDKLFTPGTDNGIAAHETTNGVQNEFLRVLEAETTETFGAYGKFETTRVDNVLFIFAGAFNNQENITTEDLSGFGVKTEFLGRVNLVYNMTKPLLGDMYTALEDSPLLDEYLRIFTKYSAEEVKITITGEINRLYDDNEIGLRLLTSLINKYFINGGKLNEDKEGLPF